MNPPIEQLFETDVIIGLLTQTVVPEGPRRKSDLIRHVCSLNEDMTWDSPLAFAETAREFLSHKFPALGDVQVDHLSLKLMLREFDSSFSPTIVAELTAAWLQEERQRLNLPEWTPVPFITSDDVTSYVAAEARKSMVRQLRAASPYQARL